jgi:hypothetical protein
VSLPNRRTGRSGRRGRGFGADAWRWTEAGPGHPRRPNAFRLSCPRPEGADHGGNRTREWVRQTQQRPALTGGHLLRPSSDQGRGLYRRDTLRHLCRQLVEQSGVRIRRLRTQHQQERLAAGRDQTAQGPPLGFPKSGLLPEPTLPLRPTRQGRLAEPQREVEHHSVACRTRVRHRCHFQENRHDRGRQPGAGTVEELGLLIPARLREP